MHRITNSRPGVALLAMVVAIIATGAAPAHAAFQSDDFHAAELDTTLWTVVDPQGDASLVATGTNLLVHVPGRLSHTLWSDCACAPMLLQTIGNTDFQLEAKFDAQVSQQYQIQGFVIREDADTFLRFDVHYNGGGPRIFAAYINGINPPSVKINSALGVYPPYLRVSRSGDTWTLSYSTDGTLWTNAGSFSRLMSVDDGGVFVGNEAVDPYDTPAFTASIDYVFNTASPIAPEDGGQPNVDVPPVVELWYGDSMAAGQHGVPQDFANVLGTVWGPSGIASLSYTLNGGASTPLTVGPDGARLVGFGDYNIEVPYDDLMPGSNSVVITATDTLGATRDTTVTIDYTAGVVWALPDTVSWSTASSIADESAVVDGLWSLENDGVRIDASHAGYDRLLVAGDRTWTTDYEVTLPFTVHEGALGGPTSIDVVVGWQGHSGATQPRVNGLFQALARVVNFTTTPTLELTSGGSPLASVPVTAVTGQRYFMKVRSQSIGADQSDVSVRFWADGSPEPTTWDIDETVSTRDGSVLFDADHCDATFGDAVITPVPSLGYTLDTTAIGAGVINRSPNYSVYPESTVVSLDAVPDSTYAFLGWNGGLSGRSTPASVTMVSDTSVSAVFVPGIVSDDFHATDLDTTLWQVVDPVGDVTIRMSGTNLLFDIPGGVSHDLWSECNCAPRILQPAADTDFDIEAKFDSKGHYLYQSQGIIVQQDFDTFLRFDVVYTGSGYSVFSGYVDGASATSRINHTPSVHPTYVRVTRTGDQWRMRYSNDGQTWYTAGTYTQALAVSNVGVFAANHNDAVYSTPAYVANVDFFFNRAAPVVPEDGGAPSAPTPPIVNVWYGDTQAVGQHGTPEMWWNVLGNIVDSDSLVSVSYTVNGGASTPLTLGPDDKRLTGVGDFIVEIPDSNLVPGANTVMITAMDDVGDQTNHAVTLNYTPGVWWDLPDTADFAAATQLSDVAHPVTGLWDLTPEGLRTATGRTGYDRCVVLGDIDWLTDYEVEGTVVIHAGNLGGVAGVGYIVGWRGHQGPDRPRTDPPFQAAGWIRDVPDAPRLELRDDELVHSTLSVPVAEDSTYRLKLRSEYVSPSMRQVSVKMWPDGTSEPAGWQLSDQFTARDGSLLLVAHEADATFGEVTVTPLSQFPANVLTVNVVGGGSVARNPSLPAYTDGQQVVVTAAPDSGWVFDSWSDGLSGTAPVDTIVMTSDTTITANFVEEAQYALTVNVNGNGTVERSPDKPFYSDGDSVIVTAVPDSAWAFDSWSDGLSGTAPVDTIVMSSDTTITANFVLEAQYALTVNINGNGSVQRTPNKALYVPGESVVVLAVPDSAWTFDSWSDGLSGTAVQDTIVMMSDTTISATFVPETYAINLSIIGNGSVTRAPDKAHYDPGEEVILTATPDTLWSFVKWKGDLMGAQMVDTVTVNTSLNITAVFGRYQVVIDIVGSGMVDLSPNKTYYLPGEEVTLTATGTSGYRFDSWDGDLISSMNPATVTVDTTLGITATFTETPTGVGDTPALTRLTVRHNAPNPFTAGTFLSYGLPSDSDVQVDVYDPAGRLVSTIRIPAVTAGWHRLYFDGRDSSGRELPSGVYFYRVQTRYATVAKKMVIVR